MAENDAWGPMDQLPLPVVLRRLGVRPGAFPETLWQNSWFDRGDHRDDY